MKKKNFPVTNIGTISLMMIFIVLCMVTFAALSLSSASSDARFSQKMEERMKEYYAASDQAEEILAVADTVFAEAYEASTDTEDYFSRISKELSDTLELDTNGERLEISYQVGINATQALQIEISVLPLAELQENGAESFYRIHSWQVIHTDTWESDNTLHLM